MATRPTDPVGIGRLELPWASIGVAVLLVAANVMMNGACTADAAERYGFGPRAGLLSAALSFFPHVSVTHLVLNAAYLVSVGIFVEPMIGRSRAVLALLLCHVGGAAFVTAFAASTYVEIGSSNAIHGLLACGYMTALLTCRCRTMQLLCVAGLAYFIYMSVHAILTGHMPWPVSFFRNGGWGHLGGITVGTVFGTVVAGRFRTSGPGAAEIALRST